MGTMEVASIEVLLLDTLEKEGEDNKLFHTREHGTETQSRWSDLRGVFAAAMGTMKSVAGEPLATIEFKTATDNPTIVGFVDLNEVLFVMVFVDCELPLKITDYYTRSSCELLVSLLGYPNQKLSDWQGEKEAAQLDTKLERICQRIFQCIRRDLRFDTHLQFAFDGSVPAVTYPLETMARLSAFQVIEPLSDVYEVEGYALFYRKMLVAAKTTPEILKLLSQWFLHGDFDSEAETGNGVSVLRFKWFDAHYALYGVFPPIHSLVLIRHGDIQCFYLLRHSDMKAFEPYKGDPSCLLSTEDLNELIQFADSLLKHHYDALVLELRANIKPGEPMWYCIVLDKLRHTLHGFMPTELFAPQQADALDWTPMLELLACEPSESFQRERVFPSEATPDPSTRKHWIPPVKVDFDKCQGLLWRPVCPEEDAGADIASEETQIFPPVHHQLEKEAIESVRKHPGGELAQEAARMCLADGRDVWVIANYYEVFELFAVCEAAVPIERLEQEMDALLRFE